MSSRECPDDEAPRMGERCSALKDKLPPAEKKPVESLEEPEEETAEPSDEGAWDEDYDEHVDGEEPEPLRPKTKKRRIGRWIVLGAVLIILLLWTIFAPNVLPEVGTTYIEQPYATLGDYTGYRDIWAGNMTWGVAISGPSQATVGETINITVRVTKIYEKPGNWFFQGTAVSMRSASLYDENGTSVGTMSDSENGDVGPIVTIPVTFSEPGGYYLYLSIRFLVTMDMLIGFLPLEAIDIPQAYLDYPIVVS